MLKTFIHDIAIFITVISSHATLAQSWLCLPEKATGFIFNGKTWVYSDFTTDHKYIFRPVTSHDKENYYLLEDATWIIFQMGRQFPIGECRIPVDKQPDPSSKATWHCQRGGTVFQINFNSQRYTMSFLGSYTNADTENADTGPDTPVIEIGKCTPL